MRCCNVIFIMAKYVNVIFQNRTCLCLFRGIPPTNRRQLSTDKQAPMKRRLRISRSLSSRAARLASTRVVYVAKQYPRLAPLKSIISRSSYSSPNRSSTGTSSSLNQNNGDLLHSLTLTGRVMTAWEACVQSEIRCCTHGLQSIVMGRIFNQTQEDCSKC